MTRLWKNSDLKQFKIWGYRSSIRLLEIFFSLPENEKDKLKIDPLTKNILLSYVSRQVISKNKYTEFMSWCVGFVRKVAAL